MNLNLAEWMLLSLALLFIKHYYIDFVNQDDEEVRHKGIYLDWRGVKHSIKQGLGTVIVFSIMGDSLMGAWVLGFLDFSLHYHIDWLKMNYGNRDVTNPRFWNHLGLDQLAHYLTYLGLLWLLVGDV